MFYRLVLLPFAGLAGFGPVGRLMYVPGIGFVLLVLLAGRNLTRGTRDGRVAAVVMALAYSSLLALLVLPQNFTNPLFYMPAFVIFSILMLSRIRFWKFNR